MLCRGPAGKAFPGGKNKYDLCCGITVAASASPWRDPFVQYCVCALACKRVCVCACASRTLIFLLAHLLAVQDQPNINKGWANSSWERRQEIIADHTYFEMGTFYYLANDPKVPQHIRDKFQSTGCAKTSLLNLTTSRRSCTSGSRTAWLATS